VALQRPDAAPADPETRMAAFGRPFSFMRWRSQRERACGRSGAECPFAASTRREAPAAHGRDCALFGAATLAPSQSSSKRSVRRLGKAVLLRAPVRNVRSSCLGRAAWQTHLPSNNRRRRPSPKFSHRSCHTIELVRAFRGRWRHDPGNYARNESGIASDISRFPRVTGSERSATTRSNIFGSAGRLFGSR
jgi:hypothetical protein